MWAYETSSKYSVKQKYEGLVKIIIFMENYGGKEFLCNGCEGISLYCQPKGPRVTKQWNAWGWSALLPEKRIA